MSERPWYTIEMHAHSAASFDSTLPIKELVRLAAAAGVTNLAITDHDTLDGAHEAQSIAPQHLKIIVGQEIRTYSGDMIGLFVSERVDSGMSPDETSQAIRAQGGLVGLPHGFDAYRPSIAVDLVRPEQLAQLARLVDYVEVHNGRVRDSRANERAAEFARQHAIPGVAASDCHIAKEVGLATVSLVEDPDTAALLSVALRGELRLHVYGVRPASETLSTPLGAARLGLHRLARLLPHRGGNS